MLRRDPLTVDAAKLAQLDASKKPKSKIVASSYTIAAQKKAYGMPVDMVAKNETGLQMVWGPGNW